MNDVPLPWRNPKIERLQSIRNLQGDITALTLEKDRLEKSLTAVKAQCNFLRIMNVLPSAENTNPTTTNIEV
jgi:hypothetical protein